ncbi:protein of unknown function [Taphrina deformans PYCC 5710]|uniref:CCHC-type domain-containing protein n=1 Tax=Taphrina deformans (strain PYCC 5710 / ATCC 11124 / CBS 356.35 / IMI 108563 / JCM 9778 / NBRC 8474) TaxID=1097556 RepID=R4XGD0_TAPDE|nr:protein of unknown function [Taphrina deformans PYCC 5710]|eukprot:CCG84957.1 protein of unknown function [Taphrina deformans PYCC 5710]
MSHLDKTQRFYGEKASGQTDQFDGSAEEWLSHIRICLRYAHIPEGITRDRAFLDTINLRLAGTAKRWANDNLACKVAFTSDNTNPDEDKKQAAQVASLLIQRFPPVHNVTQLRHRWNAVENWKQDPNESLDDYYERSAGQMVNLGLTDSDSSELSLVLMDKLVQSFIEGMADKSIAWQTAQRSPKDLYTAYTTAIDQQDLHNRFGSPSNATLPSFSISTVQPAIQPVITTLVPPPAQNSITSRPYSNKLAGDRVNRHGLPPAESKEAFELCSDRVKDIIRSNGRNKCCVKCGEANHLANECNSGIYLSKEDQCCLCMFIGLPFTLEYLPSNVLPHVRAVLNVSTGFDNSQYSWMDPLPPQVDCRSVSIGFDIHEDDPERSSQSCQVLKKGRNVRASSSKRVRIEDLLDLEDGGRSKTTEDGSRIKTTSIQSRDTDIENRDRAIPKVRTGKKKVLAPIRGMVGKDQWSISDLLWNTKVDINFLQLLAISPNQRRELSRVLASANPKDLPKKRSVKLTSVMSLNPEGRQVLSTARGKSKGSFYVSANAKMNGRSGDSLPFDRVVVDAGSEINLVLTNTLTKLGLKYMSLTGTRYESMYMRTSSGDKRYLSGWVDINLDVGGCAGIVQFFVLDESENKTGYSFLLGIPWLAQFHASMNMTKMEVSLRLSSGRTVTLQGPEYVPDDLLRLSHKSLNDITSDIDANSTEASSDYTSEDNDDGSSEEDSIVSSNDSYSEDETTAIRESRSIQLHFNNIPYEYIPADDYLHKHPSGPFSVIAKGITNRQNRFTLVNTEDPVNHETGEALILDHAPFKSQNKENQGKA